MDLTSTLTLALALLASLAVGGFLLLQHRHQQLLEKVVQQRVDLMALVRVIEFRAISVRGYPPGAAHPFTLLAGDLRSDFRDYFPPDIGHGLTDEHDARRA